MKLDAPSMATKIFGPVDLASRPVDHLHGVTGEVDEQPLARNVDLAQRRLQPSGPSRVSSNSTGSGQVRPARLARFR
jgi:hypothetical protein